MDLIVTSPPYFALRSYQDGGGHYDGQVGGEETPGAFLEALWAATAEMARVLKPSGSIFVNLGDKYAGTGGGNGQSGLLGVAPIVNGADRRSHPRNNTKQTTGFVPAKSLMGLPWRYANGVVDQLGLILRRDLIWDKPNGLPESVTDRCRSSHEYWFHFVKQGQYFSAIDELREVYKGDRALSRRVKHPGEGKHDQRAAWAEENPLGRLPGSVWTIPLEPLIIPDSVRAHYDLPDHFAAFPQEWPRRLILGWSPARAGVVLDPFGGTGTVAMVARALGRIGLSGDLSGDYCRLARWRIYESGHAAKSEDRTWRDAQGAML